MCTHFTPTHQVGDYLAHGGSEDEVLQDVWDEREGHAEDGHHQVADRQRQQEGVGDGPHALVQRQDDDDQQVAEDAEQEDERVQQDTEGVQLWRRIVENVKRFFLWSRRK